ncbi:MAG: hypothetical protein Q9204_005747, partial [Flavoplaca sp. TL-2023a]
RLAQTCKHMNAIWSHFKAIICKTILARTLDHYDEVHSLAKMQESQNISSDEEISSPDPNRLFSAILRIAEEGRECFHSVVASITFPPAQFSLNIYPNRTIFTPSEISRFLYVFYRTWQLYILLGKGGKPLDKLSADDVDKSFFATTSNRELYLLSAVAHYCAYDRDKRKQHRRGLACCMDGITNDLDHCSRSNPCPWEAAVTVILKTARQRARDDGQDCVPGARLGLSAIRECRQHLLDPKQDLIHSDWWKSSERYFYFHVVSRLERSLTMLKYDTHLSKSRRTDNVLDNKALASTFDSKLEVYSDCLGNFQRPLDLKLLSAMPNISWPILTAESKDGQIKYSRELTYSDVQDMVSIPSMNQLQILSEDGKLREDTTTIENLMAASRATLDKLFGSWSQLRNITSQYMTPLEKRWRRKTDMQRRAILIKVCPGIPPMHRPDFVALRKGCRRDELPFSLEIALRLPYINLEDLCKPDRLMLFLGSRSNKLPAMFTNMDRSHLRVGLRSGMLSPDYVRGHTMYLNGEMTRDRYGCIISWEQDRESALKCYTGVAPDPGIGLMILRVQSDVLEFLVRCSVAIMHDIPMTELCERPKQIHSNPSVDQTSHEPVRRVVQDTAAIDSLCAHMLEAPYRIPDMVDFARLRSFVQARRSEVEDKFHFIREDPRVFAELMHEASADAGQNCLDDQPKKRAKDSIWNTAISSVIATSYTAVFRWGAVSYLSDRLMDTYREHKDGIQPGTILPSAFVEAFSRLDYLLDHLIDIRLTYLLFYLKGAPTLERRKCLMFGEPSKSQKDDYLFWLFYQLEKRRTDGEPQVCSIHSILQETEILITKNSTERDRLTPSLIRMISELSVLAEMQRELSLSSCNERILSAMPRTQLLASIDPLLRPLHNIQKVLKENSFDLASLVHDLRVFDYPSDKPSTAANTAKMRRAEQALDHFWEQVDQHFARKTGKTLKELEENIILHRDIERTREWEYFSTHSNEKVHVSEDTCVADAALALLDLQERTESTTDKSQILDARRKVKTRNAANLNAEITSPATASEDSGDTSKIEAAKIKLKKKAYKAAFPTFAKIFGKPVINELSGKTVEELSGKIPWHQFITAMSRAGFGAEKLQGSCWLFSSDDRSIMFHEPHPESDLTTHLARGIARRLNRNFGWTVESFVLDDTTGGEILAST